MEQNPDDFTLTPKIGWMIRKKDVDKKGLVQKFESDNHSDWVGIKIRVQEIPDAIFQLNEIGHLEISFIDRIIIPDKLGKIDIKRMALSGKTTPQEIERIKRMFPETELRINNENIHVP